MKKQIKCDKEIKVRHITESWGISHEDTKDFKMHNKLTKTKEKTGPNIQNDLLT